MRLETVQQAFKEWRDNKAGQNRHVPKQLWGMVQALLADYKPNTLRTALGISNQQLKRYCTDIDDREPIALAHDGFIEAQLPLPSSDCKVTLQGLNRTLRIEVSMENLGKVLPFLGAYL